MKPKLPTKLLVCFTFIVLFFQYYFVLPDVVVINNNSFEKYYGFISHQAAVVLGIIFKTLFIQTFSLCFLIFIKFNNKIPVVNFLLISLWFIIISSLGVLYLFSISFIRNNEYLTNYSKFNPEIKISNERIKEVNDSVGGYSFAGPGAFYIKYNYIAEISLFNQSDKEYLISLYKRIIFPDDSPMRFERFNNYEYQGNPYPPFKEQAVLIKSGVNNFTISG